MYGEGERSREGMYQNARLLIHTEGGQKIGVFAYVPNRKSVIKKLAKLLKASYCNWLFDTNILTKLVATFGAAPKKMCS